MFTRLARLAVGVVLAPVVWVAMAKASRAGCPGCGEHALECNCPYG